MAEAIGRLKSLAGVKRLRPGHAAGALALLGLCSPALLRAHDATPVTHSFDRGQPQPGPRLRISIDDAATGAALAARFTVVVDGHDYVPAWIDEHGIRFTSIHRTKRQEFTACYARGSGAVTIGLPSGARQVEVTAVRGFEYRPAHASAQLTPDRASIALRLDRWIDLEAQGWIGVDEHLHYDRMDPAVDATWLTMLEADGLAAGHFMTLKGGMMPGVWARQYAHGAKGQATDGQRLIVPGQEYRDSAQGHINLLGIAAIIEPISTGGMGTPPTRENFPPLHDVLRKARESGGLAGVAHAGTLGRSPTAMADAVLGAVDFWELSNGFIYDTASWYRLMNCGVFIPPAAGTDLPNSPFRDPWQPMLGSVRMYVQTGGRHDFSAFKSAVSEGRVFISEGPILFLTVNGKGPGETIRLPAEGGTVMVRAELHSAQELRQLEVIHNGRAIEAPVRRSSEETIQRWTIEQRLEVRESGWLAAAAVGPRVASLNIDARAHTGVVRVLVGDRPIRRTDDTAQVESSLTQQREYYQRKGRYRSEAERRHVLSLFDQAIARIRSGSFP